MAPPPPRREATGVAQVLSRLPIEGRDAVGITDGTAEADYTFASIKAKREASFPLELVRQAFTIRLQDGRSTMPEDRRHILNHIAGRASCFLEAEVLDTCGEYTTGPMPDSMDTLQPQHVVFGQRQSAQTIPCAFPAF